MATSACSTPFGRDPAPRASREPRPELAAPAATLPAAEQPPPRDAGGTDTTGPVTATTAAPAPTTSVVATTSTTERLRRVATLDDAAGDAGLQAPAYADLVTVALEDTGAVLRIVVDVAADVPTELPDGEVQGIGIDIYRSDTDESDYQVFLDGGSDGWRAYLQTPEGFVDYPGTFAVGGRRLVAEVPWAAAGGRGRGAVSAFCDWSARATPLNRSGADRAPDRGTATFRT